MNFFRLSYFLGGPRAAGTLYRDRDAFEGTAEGPGVLPLLRALGEFDEVTYSDSVSTAPVASTARRWAHVTVEGQGNKDQGAPGRRLRVVQYAIYVRIDEPDGPDSDAELDRLYARIFNALDGVEFGGFCLFDQSRLERDTATTVPSPGASMRIMGQVAYVTSRRAGGLSTAR